MKKITKLQGSRIAKVWKNEASPTKEEWMTQVIEYLNMDRLSAEIEGTPHKKSFENLGKLIIYLEKSSKDKMIEEYII
uniref:Uncharacterized protein n=1 Tax=Sphaerodactylus townsendi TaxID=933632 RepID=A0ACB8FLU8_9SAUR